MHQDKKREELEQKKEFEQLQRQEELFDNENTEKEQQEDIMIEIVAEEKDGFEEFENEMQRARKKKREMIFEFALFLILGILIGITIKTEAVKKITIGFDDYQIESGKNRYDIAGIEAGLEQKALEQQKAIENVSEQQNPAQQ